MAHLEGALHVLKYLKGTIDSGICYKTGGNTKVQELCDSSHLTCLDTGRSRAGLVFLSTVRAICWRSKLLPNATLSGCESENLALSMARQEVSYLRQLQIEILEGAAIP